MYVSGCAPGVLQHSILDPFAMEQLGACRRVHAGHICLLTFERAQVPSLSRGNTTINISK